MMNYTLLRIIFLEFLFMKCKCHEFDTICLFYWLHKNIVSDRSADEFKRNTSYHIGLQIESEVKMRSIAVL